MYDLINWESINIPSVSEEKINKILSALTMLTLLQTINKRIILMDKIIFNFNISHQKLDKIKEKWRWTYLRKDMGTETRYVVLATYYIIYYLCE